jgi:hypothetical protein
VLLGLGPHRRVRQAGSARPMCCRWVQVRRGARITGLLVQVLLLAKAVAVAISAPDNVWPAAEPRGNVGLLAMFLSIGVSVICSGEGLLRRGRPVAAPACAAAGSSSCCRACSCRCLSAAPPQLR